jgi:hypothetical protein
MAGNGGRRGTEGKNDELHCGATKGSFAKKKKKKKKKKFITR